ncbi:MAG: hypothetical protein JNK47_11095 [Mesorhizobium sp.]|nr:hypothetical protein [Mesorhizobium sp.]MBL8577765.1 hypothetical protein [Mesorhizobium sp.]
MTLAELAAGEVWTPDQMVLEARRCDEAGNRLPPETLRLTLPPELRANTYENVVEVVRRFRRISEEIRAYVDGFALFMPKAGGPIDGLPMWAARTVPG